MRVLVAIASVAAALLAPPSNARACSLSATPAAYVLAPGNKPPGRQPLIALWQVDKPVVVTQVPASCKPKTICRGTPVAVERGGVYLRPKTMLPDGARIQVTMGNVLLADETVAAHSAPALLGRDGIELISAKHEKAGLCSPAGPVVRLQVKPTKADLAGAWLLVYLEKPDPKQPMAKLQHVAGLNPGREIELGNGLGMKPWLLAVPKQLWVIPVDADGNVGSVIRLP